MSEEPQCKRGKMSTSLDQLKALTTVVADTGDFEGISVHSHMLAVNNLLIMLFIYIYYFIAIMKVTSK
jgi:transaldolase